MSIKLKIIAGYIVLLLIAGISIYYNFKGSDTTVTYDPMTNPAVQKLLMQYAIDTAKANETIRQNELQKKAAMEFSLNALKSVSNSEAQVVKYINQITTFNQKINAIKDEKELQEIINQLYIEVHR